MQHPPTDARGRRLGRYVLLGTIGRGGMGEVVRARAFGVGGATKDLCLKRIHGHRLASPGALERFVEEARLSLRLAHANIVAVFDFGRAGDEHYLAMEWIDGADLRALLHDALPHDAAQRAAAPEPFAPAVAAHVAAEIARALAYAHGLRIGEVHGVVHCDVKPANVLIARTGDVKLTDFGVATAIASARGGGTPGYVPAERAHAATPAADLYALGVVLAELLTGERPSSRAAIAGRVPADLEPWIARMLEEDPGLAASEVAQALESFVARERARSAIAPRDDLARRASRVADAHGADDRAGGTFEATASWARDGDAAFTEPTAPTAGSRGSEPPRRGRGPRGVWLSVVAIATLTLASVVAYQASREPVMRDARGGAHGAAPAVAGPPAIAAAPARIEAGALGGAGAGSIHVESHESAPGERDAHAREPDERVLDVRAVGRGAGDRGPAASSGSRRRSAPVAPPEPAEVAVSDDALEPAHLRINAIPWAEVELDGRALGVTPLLDVVVAPGRHTLRFVNGPLGMERLRDLEIAARESRDLVVEME